MLPKQPNNIGVILDEKGNPITKTSMQSYSGANGGYNNELSSWNAHPTSVDFALLPDFEEGNARTADLSRNNTYAKTGVQLHVDHVVGQSFKVVHTPNYRALGLTRKQLRQLSREIESKFEDWGGNNRKFIDSERKRTFTMIIREGIATHCKTGEICAKIEWIRKRGSKFQTSIKLIDFSRLSNPEGAENTNKLRAGVEMDSNGAAIAYHVRKRIPNDIDGAFEPDNYEWIRVPREMSSGRYQFIHLFEPTGEGQSRGANDFYAGLSKLKMLEKFQGSVLQNAIVSAMYAAVITSEANSDDVFKAMSSGTSEGSLITGWMETTSKYHDQTKLKVGDTTIPHLLPNEKLDILGVKTPSGNLGDFESGILRSIAKSLGVSYEQLSGDFSKTNYSSARAAMSESYLYFMGRREIIAKAFASMIFELWLEEAINIGEIKLPKGAPSFYEARSAWSKCDWIGSGKAEIDGLKSAKTSELKLKLGLTTMAKELGKAGDDWRDILDEQDNEDEELEARGRLSIWRRESPLVEEEDEDFDENGDPVKSGGKTETNENPEVDTNAD